MPGVVCKRGKWSVKPVEYQGAVAAQRGGYASWQIRQSRSTTGPGERKTYTARGDWFVRTL